MTKVVFPCDQETWWQVKDGLHQLRQLCLEDDVDFRRVAIQHQCIVNISIGIGDYGITEYKQTTFYNLAQFFIKKAIPNEREHFLKVTLPGIIDLALKVESLLPTEGIAVSEQQNAETRLLERQLCCSVLACAFLCLIPDTYRQKLGRTINFTKFFSFLYLSSQMAKLRCLLNFFDRVAEEYDRLEGNIQFTRLVMKRDELPTLDTWLNSTAELCPLQVKQTGCIEDSCPEAIEVDFANKYIGGGTVGKGRVQEEIRFTVCPELIVSMLFMEYMEENEAIFIKGYEQFARTDGYAGGLTYVGDCKDTCQRDVDGLLKNTLCAIDAISYSHREGASLSRQYQDYYVLRDLNKAFVGFSTPFIIPEDQPERLSHDEDYYTADEDTSRTNDQINAVDLFVDDLIRQAMVLALPEALNNKLDHLSASSKPDNTDRQNVHPPINDEVHMNHLEVNFRDWYANYRRRSSNLSDLSSRRSSWDVASRRSSGCSMRGYSSEFSSEFEEYYDNFQSQDQKYSFHTIKEESGPSTINEFATSLASSLLQQCTLEVSQLESGIQKFDDTRPVNVENPQPYRLNPIAEAGVNCSEMENSSENSVRMFVDHMFKEVWPFGTSNERNQVMRGYMVTSLNLEKASKVVDINDNNAVESCQPEISYEDYLFDVADKIVYQAMEEALVEYRYRYVSPAIRNVEAQVSTDSSQSDHSSGYKDQSYPSKIAQNLLDNQSEMASHFPATDLPTLSSSAQTVAERVVLRLFDSADRRDVNNSNNQTCDISNTEASQTFIHSSPNGPSPSHNLDLYNRVADRLLSGGLSSSSSQSINVDNSVSDSASGSVQSALPGGGSHCLTDHYQFCDMLGNHPSYIHSALTCDSSSSQQGSSLHSKSRNSNSAGSSRGSTGKSSSKNSKGKSPQTGSKVKSSSKLSLDNKSAINSSESSNTPSSDSEKLSSGSYTGLLDDKVERKLGRLDKSPEGARPKTRINFHDPLHHGSHRHHHHHHHHHHVVGSKKNYDQFANCLSRDLLTNAFIQVQEHTEPFVYPRRSSEPLQISDGVALQRLENSIHCYNGKRSQKSMTVEDIGQFEEAWSYELECYRKMGTGFRDPILSRFAEELMKVNVSIPTLQLLSDCVSTSGSSRSVCSTISSFRDPLLASFEDELLNTSLNRGQGSFKTQISWSRMKGGMCSPRQNETLKPKSGKQRVNSISIESEISGISYKSAKSGNNVLVCSSEVGEFAESLARRILCEALTATAVRAGVNGRGFNIEMYSDLLAKNIVNAAVMDVEKKCSDWLEQSKMVTWSDETDTHEYSGDSSQQITSEVLIDDQRSLINSLENGSSCVEYEDALNFPFTRLEEFADDLASRVLQNSVAITKREKNAALRRLYGRPISTGNWGCGAFGGDPHLKSLLQWLAASYAGTPSLIYYTFNHHQMEKDVIEIIQNRGWDVSMLMQAIRRYCITAESELRLTGAVSKDLFTVILQGEVFPGT